MGIFSRKSNVEKMKEKRDVRGLIKALRRWEIRDEAKIALLEIVDDRTVEAIEPLIEILKDENIHTFEADDVLKKIGRLAAESLIQELKHGDRRTRARVAIALGHIGDDIAVQPLIQAITDEDNLVRYNAAEALGEIGSKKAVEPLKKMMDSCREAAKALVEIGITARDAELLMPGLKEVVPDSFQFERIIKALAETNDERAVDPLIKALKSKDTNIRLDAIRGLGEIGDKRAVEPLISQLQRDKDKDIREYAAYALANIGDKRAINPLIKVLQKKPDQYERKAAYEALGVICPPAVGTLVKQTIYDDPTDSYIYYSHFVHRDTARLIEKIHDVDGLIEVLSDSDEGVRSFSCKALGELGDRRAVEPLRKALNDEDEAVCEAAKEAIKKIQEGKDL